MAVIFGESGSGKTTFLRCLAGYLTPSDGVVRIGRRARNPWSIKETGLASSPHDRSLRDLILALQRLSLHSPSATYTVKGRGHLPTSWLTFADDRTLFGHLTARKNLEVVLRPLCRDPVLRETVSDLLLRVVGLQDTANQRPAELSTGQLRRLGIAQALAGDFDLLLLDEPTSNLDAATKYELLDLLQRLQLALGLTGVAVTHDIETALLLADELYYFRHGQVKHVAALAMLKPRLPEDLGEPEYARLRRQMLGLLDRGGTTR